MFLLLFFFFITSAVLVGSEDSFEDSLKEGLEKSLIVQEFKLKLRDLEGKSQLNLLEKCEHIHSLYNSYMTQNTLSELEQKALCGYATKKGEDFVDSVRHHDKENFSRSINQLCQKPYEQIDKVFFIAPSLLIPAAQKMYYKSTWNKDAGKKIIEKLLNNFTSEYAESIMSCVYDKQQEDDCTDNNLIFCLKPFTVFSDNYLILRQSINDGNAMPDEKKSLVDLLNSAYSSKVPLNLLRVLYGMDYDTFVEQFAWRLLSNQSPFYFLEVIIDNTKKLGALADTAKKVKELCNKPNILDIVLPKIKREEIKLINQN